MRYFARCSDKTRIDVARLNEGRAEYFDPVSGTWSPNELILRHVDKRNDGWIEIDEWKFLALLCDHEYESEASHRRYG